MQLGPNFSLEAFTLSQEAIRHNLPNIPNAKQIEAAKRLVVRVLQPLRDHLKRPVIVSSGFRSFAVNRAVRGARNSQHCKGEAADIYVSGMTTRQLVDTILMLHLPFDQVIDEFGSWVHVSHAFTGPQRGEVLVARMKGKRRVYSPYERT